MATFADVYAGVLNLRRELDRSETERRVAQQALLDVIHAHASDKYGICPECAVKSPCKTLRIVASRYSPELLV